MQKAGKGAISQMSSTPIKVCRDCGRDETALGPLEFFYYDNQCSTCWQNAELEEDEDGLVGDE